MITARTLFGAPSANASSTALSITSWSTPSGQSPLGHDLVGNGAPSGWGGNGGNVSAVVSGLCEATSVGAGDVFVSLGARGGVGLGSLIAGWVAQPNSRITAKTVTQIVTLLIDYF